MRRKNKMIVYELGWWYLDEESGKSDEQVIAVYSSEQLAQKAIERFKIQPRFIGHEEDFYISKYIINHEEWKELNYNLRFWFAKLNSWKPILDKYKCYQLRF